MYEFGFSAKYLTDREKLIIEIVDELSKENLINYDGYPDPIIADSLVCSLISGRLKDFHIIKGTLL